jgi:hypothetical protein
MKEQATYTVIAHKFLTRNDRKSDKLSTDYGYGFSALFCLQAALIITPQVSVRQ